MSVRDNLFFSFASSDLGSNIKVLSILRRSKSSFISFLESVILFQVWVLLTWFFSLIVSSITLLILCFPLHFLNSSQNFFFSNFSSFLFFKAWIYFFFLLHKVFTFRFVVKFPLHSLSVYQQETSLILL